MIHNESDDEMKSFLKAEMEENEAKLPEYEERMKVLLLPRDPMDDKDIMLEIRGSAGGDEANIFAGDLARMYMRYADKKDGRPKFFLKQNVKPAASLKLLSQLKVMLYIHN